SAAASGYVQWSPCRRVARGLRQAFQEILQFAHFGRDMKRLFRHVHNLNGQQAIVTETLELRENAAVFYLTLSDTHLHLVRCPSRVSEIDVTHIGIDMVERAILMRTADVMARIEREPQTIDPLTERGGGIRRFGQRADVRRYGQDDSFRRGGSDQITK